MSIFYKKLNFTLISYFTEGHERSIKIKKNIATSLLIKGISIVISLVLIPITINFINPSRYGIWITLSSIVGWFSFFDIGLTQGLRNRFAEAKAKGDISLAQIYVSTSYAVLGIIFFSIWVLFLITNNFLDWTRILNTPENFKTELSTLAIIVFTYFCLTFVLKIITTILIADQEPAKSSLIDLIGQVLSLILIFVLIKTTEGSLIKLGIALCISPVVALIVANLFFFRGPYKIFRPTLATINFFYTKNLFNLGLTFFVIQVAGVIQYQTANLIIAHNFGPSEVTSYSIVYKYFGTISLIFAIFLTPFWSASTEAFIKKDIGWIRKGIKKYNQLYIFMIFIGLIMLIFSKYIYTLWLGESNVNITFSLSLWGFLFFIISMFGATYVYFLNGINALRIQFWASLLSPFVYFGVAIFLLNYCKIGVHALFIASLIANFNGFILAPLQYYQVISKSKKGIWIK